MREYIIEMKKFVGILFILLLAAACSLAMRMPDLTELKARSGLAVMSTPSSIDILIELDTALNPRSGNTFSGSYPFRVKRLYNDSFSFEIPGQGAGIVNGVITFRLNSQHPGFEYLKRHQGKFEATAVLTENGKETFFTKCRFDFQWYPYALSQAVQENNSTAVRHLHLIYSDFSEKFPEEIFQFKEIRRLDVAGIKSGIIAPDRFTEFKKLRHLVYWGNIKSRGTIPQNYLELILKVNSLRTLEVYSCGDKIMPAAIGNQQYLDSLIIDTWYVDSIPQEIWKLASLKKLSLLMLELNELPEGIGNLQALEKLKLHDICHTTVTRDSLKTLPSAIGRLQNLRHLVLINNYITELPAAIGKLSSLVEFRCQEDALKVIPESFSNLEKLRVINLHAYTLEDLPESFCKFPYLEKFTLNCNSLKKLPLSIGDLRSVHKMFIQAPLQDIPSSFSKLSSLRTLSINISCADFPDVITMLPQLEDLSFRTSHRNVFSDKLFDMPSLKSINIDQNQYDKEVLDAIAEKCRQKGISFYTKAIFAPHVSYD